jgi:anti-sigma factor RsiW
MNCEKCQEQLSDFLDGTLGHAEHASVSAHLAACRECDEAREEFNAIFAAARDAHEFLYAPSDERALWMRVRDAVESDGLTARRAAAATRTGFWPRLLNTRFQLSFPQLASGVAALVVSVAFATAVAVRYTGASKAPRADRAVRRVVSDDLYPGAYVEPHEASLRYWEQRVAARKASWNPRMRASFDVSVSALDKTVEESLADLRNNPHDEVAEEMLNSALRDKIELMRDFGEQ